MRFGIVKFENKFSFASALTFHYICNMKRLLFISTFRIFVAFSFWKNDMSSFLLHLFIVLLDSLLGCNGFIFLFMFQLFDSIV